MGNQQFETKKAAFTGGTIQIELVGNQVSFQTGQVIQGWVHFYLMQPCFPCTYLTIGLHGFEQTKFRKRHSKTTGSGKNRRTTHYYKWHYGEKNIIDMVFPLQQFVGGPPGPGMVSFPFQMQIPDWLHPSMVLTSNHEQATMSMYYFLRAQVVP